MDHVDYSTSLNCCMTFKEFHCTYEADIDFADEVCETEVGASVEVLQELIKEGVHGSR